MAKAKNSFGIAFLTQGPAGLVKVLNQILAALDALRVQRSVDIDPIVAAEGTLLAIRNPQQGGGRVRSVVTYPLDLSLTDPGTGTYTGTFRPGTVNGLIPSNFLALAGINKTGTVYIGINVTLANAKVMSAIFAAETVPPPAFPTSMGVPPTFLTILTHVVVDGVVFRAIGNGSQFLRPIPSFTTDKTGTISPGEAPFNQWYSYQLDTF